MRRMWAEYDVVLAQGLAGTRAALWRPVLHVGAAHATFASIGPAAASATTATPNALAYYVYLTERDIHSGVYTPTAFADGRDGTRSIRPSTAHPRWRSSSAIGRKSTDARVGIAAAAPAMHGCIVDISTGPRRGARRRHDHHKRRRHGDGRRRQRGYDHCHGPCST